MLFKLLTMGLRGKFGFLFFGIPYPLFRDSVGVNKYAFLFERWGLIALITFLYAAKSTFIGFDFSFLNLLFPKVSSYFLM